MKSSGFNFFQILWKTHETMSNRRTVKSHSNTSSENENDDSNNNTENITESLQGETSVELNTTPTDNTQQNHSQIPESPYSEIFTGQVINPTVEMQQTFSEVFPSEKNQAVTKHLRLQHQRRIETTNQLLRKQELEPNQLIQQLNQLNTENQHDNILPEKTKKILSTFKKLATTKSCRNWIFHSHTIFLSSECRRTKTSIYYGQLALVRTL